MFGRDLDLNLRILWDKWEFEFLFEVLFLFTTTGLKAFGDTAAVVVGVTVTDGS